MQYYDYNSILHIRLFYEMYSICTPQKILLIKRFCKYILKYYEKRLIYHVLIMTAFYTFTNCWITLETENY